MAWFSTATAQAQMAPGTALPVPAGDVIASTFDITPIDYFKFEGTTGATTYQFSVTRTGDVSAASSVQWVVAGNGANPVDAVDFVGGVLPSGVLNFAAGQSSQTVTLNLSTDARVELDEGFIVTLSNPSAGAIVGTASATGVITNDDSVVLNLSTSWNQMMVSP